MGEVVEQEIFMMLAAQTTCADAGANLVQLCVGAAFLQGNRVVEDRDIVIIQWQNAENVALIAADELTSLIETAHLLRSPNNAARLLKVLAEARADDFEPQTIDDLRNLN